MSRNWTVVVVALLVFIPIVVSAEGGEADGVLIDPPEQASNTVIFTVSAAELDFVAYLSCNTSGTGTWLSVSVAACCQVGDVWRAIVTKGSKIDTTSNQTPGGIPFPAQVYSDPATISSSKGTIYFTTANGILGDLPADGRLKVESDGLLTCTIKRVVGGA